jgi:radical SAM protein with 4Fe4S-binding SPASM domain
MAEDKRIVRHAWLQRATVARAVSAHSARGFQKGTTRAMEAAVITTYRCNCKCHMCNVWQYPTTAQEEFRPSLLEKLPPLEFCNLTGGEPFLREDIDDIVAIARRKAKRVVISTNGFFTDRILRIAEKHPGIGVRISIEGLPAANDELRGTQDGFDHGLRTLLSLQRMGLKDIGFGTTVSDRNAHDMLELYQLAKKLNVEFATAAVHNSYYFHTDSNCITKLDDVTGCFETLIDELLSTYRVKNWFRAYFNHGLIHYIHGRPRRLPCCAAEGMFFVDPFGEVRPCNGMEESKWIASFGSLHTHTFEQLWNSPQAEEIRRRVRTCPKNCWMIGTASPAIKKALPTVAAWVIRNKLRSMLGKKFRSDVRSECASCTS